MGCPILSRTLRKGGRQSAQFQIQVQEIEVRGSHPCKERKGWAAFYNRVGVVKRHLERPKDFGFSFVEDFGVALLLLMATQSSLFRIPRWNLVPPTIYSVSYFRP